MSYPGANIFSVITIAANANYCGPLLPNLSCQLSLLPGENPRLSTSIDLLLFTLKDWVRESNGEKSNKKRGKNNEKEIMKEKRTKVIQNHGKVMLLFKPP